MRIRYYSNMDNIELGYINYKVKMENCIFGIRVSVFSFIKVFIDIF